MRSNLIKLIMIPALLLGSSLYGALELSITAQTGAAGTVIGVPVKIAATGDFASADIWLSYDPTYLTPTGTVVLGSAVADANTLLADSIVTSSNQVRISLARSELVTISSTAELVIVYFTVNQSSGSSSISFAKNVVNGSVVTATAGTISFTTQASNFNLETVSTTGGGSIPVRISVGNTEGVRGMDLWVAYDESVLNIGSVTLASALSGAGFIIQTNTAQAGLVKIAIAAPSAQTISGDIVTINFTDGGGTAGQVTPVTFSRLYVNEGSIAASGTDGSVTFYNANSAPVFSPTPGTVNGITGSVVSFNISATDADGDMVTLTAGAYPSGGSFAADMSSFSWTPASGGTYTVEVVAADGTTTTTGTWTLVINSKPELSIPGSQSVTAGDLVSFTVAVTDPDGDAVTLSASNLPSGSTFDAATGGFQWQTSTSTTATTYSVTFTATDDQGLTASGVISITVSGGGVAPPSPPPTNNPPVITQLSDISIAQGELVSFTVTASDADGDTVTLSASGDPLTLDPTASFDPATGAFSWQTNQNLEGAYTVTFLADDGQGGQATETVTINITATVTVIDTTVNHPPEISQLANVAVDQGGLATFTVSATDPDGDPVTLSATGDPFTTTPAATFNSGTGVFSWQTDQSVLGSYTVEITATDDKGLSSSWGVSISVGSVNSPPSMVAIQPQTIVSDGSALSLLVNATDPNGDEVIYSALNLPPGATFDQLTGAFNFTPTMYSSGQYEVIFKVSDGSLVAEQTVQITVVAPTMAPVLVPPPVTQYSVDPGQTVSFVVGGTDPTGETVSMTVTGLPEGASYDPGTGLFNFVPTFEQGGQVFTVGFVANDPGGLQSDPLSIVIQVNTFNRFPLLADIPAQVALEGQLLEFTLTATDPDNDPLTYSALVLPPGATLNASNGAFSWTPPLGTLGTFPVEFSVEDGNGGFDLKSTVITVGNVNRPPVIPQFAAQAVTELETVLVTVTVSDPDAGDIPVVKAEQMPDGAIFSYDAATGNGQFRWVPALGQAGSYSVRFIGTDGKLSVTQPLSITVTQASIPPVLAAIGNRNALANQQLAFQISAADPTGRLAVALSMTGLPAGATFNTSSGLFSWTPTYADLGSHEVTAIAANAAGLQDTETFAITVTGVNRAPTIDPLPNPAVVAGQLVEMLISTNDLDGDALTLTATGVPLESLGATFNQATGRFRWVPDSTVAGNYRMLFVAVDGKGGRAEVSTIITVGAANRPPSVGTLVDRQVNAGDALSFDFTATDPNGDPLTLSVVNRPGGAVTTLSPAGVGTFSWTPTRAQVGAYTVGFIVRDGSLSAEKKFEITVLAVNEAPVIAGLGDRTTAEGVRLDLTLNATDPDNDPLALSVTGLPTGATFDPAHRLFSWQPTFGQVGSYTVNFFARDPSGLADTAAVVITVTDVNREPVFGALTNQTIEAGDLLEMIIAATDPDNDTLSYTVQVPAGATFDEPTRKLSWTPSVADAGSHQASFTVKDGKGGSASRSITITVTSENLVINQPPLLDPIGAQTVETGDTLRLTVSATDPDSGTMLLLEAANLPANARFNNLTGAFTFIPTPEQEGDYSVKFIASDGQLRSEIEFEIVVVRGLNLPPVLTGVSDVSVTAGTSVRRLISAIDPEGDLITLGARNVPAGAVFNSASGEFSFTPTNDQAGTHTVEFTATDALGAASDSEMTLTVTVLNRAPTFSAPGNVATMVDSLVELVINASDPDGDSLTYASPSAAALGASFDPLTQMFTWRPSALGTYNARFTVTDGKGGNAEAAVLISVASPTQSVNNPPVFAVLQNYVIDAGTSVNFTVSATDPDSGQTLIYNVQNKPDNSSFDALTQVFTFNPPLSQVGTFSPIFTVSDGKLTSQVTAEIQVSGVNQAPVLDLIPDRSVPEGGVLEFFVTATDPDQEPVQISVTGLPQNAFFDPAGRRFRFSPDFGQAGDYDVTFSVTDPGGLTASQDVNIMVNTVNLPPVLSFIESQQALIGDLVEVVVNATDLNDALADLTFSAEGLPDGATFSPTGRVFRWIPAAGQTGSFRVTFSVSDPGGLSNSQTILISVDDPLRDLNFPPTLATVGDQSVEENSSLTFEVTGTDPDAGDEISLSARDLPDGATFSSTPAEGAVSGTFSFTPDLLQGGFYELTFVVTDGDFIDEQEIVLEVIEVDLPPVISAAGDYTVMVGETLEFEVTGNDESGEPFTLSVQNPPANSLFLPAAGRFVFRPTVDQAGITYDVIFQITDASGNTEVATSAIVVESVNLPPEFYRVGNVAIAEGDLLELYLFAYDPNGDDLSYAATGLPTGATFDAASQIFRYIPAAGFAGNSTVIFTVTDADGLSDEMSVTISVGAVNRPPKLAYVGPQTVDEGGAGINLAVAATDPDGDPITLSASALPAGATFTDNGGGAGSLQWAPGYQDDGRYRINILASDGALTDQLPIEVSVRDVNLPPALDLIGGTLLATAGLKFKHTVEGIRLAADVTEIKNFTVAEGGQIRISVRASDPADDRLAVTVRNLPKHARYEPGNRRIVFSPRYDQAGTYLVLVEVTDGVYSVSVYASITVNNTNRPPVLRPIGERYVTEGDIISFEVNASDPDRDPISFSFSGLPGVASLVNNLFTFDTELLPGDLQADAVRFVFTATDGQGGSDTQANDIAIIRSRSIDLDGGTLLAADVSAGDSLAVDVGAGIGLGITITNNTGGTAGTGGIIDVGEISGPITSAVARDIQSKGSSTSSSALASSKVKEAISLGTTQTVRLAAGGTSDFTSIRRGWQLDLTRFTPVWPTIPDSLLSDSTKVDSIMAADSIKIHFVATYLDSDMVITLADTVVKDSTIIDSLFRLGLVPAAWDSVLGQFVLLDGVVDTLTNQFYFTIPLTRDDSTAGDTAGGSLLAQIETVTASSRYTLFTLGSILDFTSPTVDALSRSFNAVSPGPIKITGSAFDEATGIKGVKLFYTISGVTDSVEMALVEEQYEGDIPVQDFGTLIEYYLQATDFQNNTARDPRSGTFIISVSEQDPSDLNADGKTNIFDVLDFLRKLKTGDAADVNMNGKTDIFDLLTLLKFLKGGSRSLLAGAEDVKSPYSQLLALSEQDQDKNYPNSFSVGIEGSSEVVAAQMVFKLGEGLEIGNLAFEVDDPMLQFFTHTDGEMLTVMLYNLNGDVLPADGKLLKISYRTASERPLNERMITLESSSFGNIEGVPVSARLTMTGITKLPRAFALGQNYPNPFNPSTTITYDIPDGIAVQVALRIYNIRGQLVMVLVDQQQESGSYSVQWNGMDRHGRRLSSGVYFYRLRAGEFTKTRKMVILK